MLKNITKGLVIAAVAATSMIAAEKINGAGATFPAPCYYDWAYNYQKATKTRVNYQSIGSGGGIKQVSERVVQFGATDAPLTPKELDKAKLYQFPAVFVSAKHKDEEIEQGFERGGDDYITKPFSMKELLLRVKAVLRRTKKLSSEGNLTYRDITLNLAARSVIIDGEAVELTKLEFDLLHTLIMNENVVLERDYLLEHVWGGDDVYQDRTVNVAINRLKEKIDPEKSKEYIKTVRGVGYTLC